MYLVLTALVALVPVNESHVMDVRVDYIEVNNWYYPTSSAQPQKIKWSTQIIFGNFEVKYRPFIPRRNWLGEVYEEDKNHPLVPIRVLIAKGWRIHSNPDSKLKRGPKKPIYDHQRKLYTMVWYQPMLGTRSVLFRVVAPYYKETWTNFDVEMKNRSLRANSKRTGLVGRPYELGEKVTPY